MPLAYKGTQSQRATQQPTLCASVSGRGDCFRQGAVQQMRRYPFSFGTFALLSICVLVGCEHQGPAGGGGGTVSPGPTSPGPVDPGVSPVEQGPPVVIVNESPLPADPLAPVVAPEGACAARTLSEPKYLPGYTPDPAVQAQAKSWVAQMTIE